MTSAVVRGARATRARAYHHGFDNFANTCFTTAFNFSPNRSTVWTFSASISLYILFVNNRHRRHHDRLTTRRGVVGSWRIAYYIEVEHC